MKYRYLYRYLLLTVCVMLFCAPQHGRAEPSVLVELYTSQGCPACPPAEKLFNELADVEGLIALSFHVDYWDGRGWKDPHGSPNNTLRQQLYSAAMELDSTYTPQMIINGVHEMVGGDWQSINRYVKHEQERSFKPVKMRVAALDAGRLQFEVDEYAGRSKKSTAEIIVFAVQQNTRDVVTKGPNRGQTLTNRNVVHGWKRFGSWHGGAQKLTLDVSEFEGADAYVVALQEANFGRILVAEFVELSQ